MTTKEAIQEMMKDLMLDQVVVAQVNSVDESAMTCQVTLNGSLKRYSVRLRSVIDDKDTGFIEVPKADSYVLVGIIGSNKQGSFIIKCSELEKVLIKVGSNTFEFNADDFKVDAGQTTLNGGNNGGLVKIDSLIAQIDQRFAALQGLIAGAAAPAAGLDSGAALAAFNSAYKGAVPPLIKSQIENPKVKH